MVGCRPPVSPRGETQARNLREREQSADIVRTRSTVAASSAACIPPLHSATERHWLPVHHANVSSKSTHKNKAFSLRDGIKTRRGYCLKAHISPTMKPSSALSHEASADASSSSLCLRTRAPRIDFPASRCRWHIDLSSINDENKSIIGRYAGEP